MNAGVQVVLSGALTFGIPLVWALRELVVLRRPQGGSWPGDEPRLPDPRPLPPDAPKRLPECLIPKLPAARPRVPELV